MTILQNTHKIITCLVIIIGIFTTSLLGSAKETPTENMVVNDVITLTECDYIVKDIETLIILDPNSYLDEKIVEIAICDDTENTLCIFVSLPKNSEKIIRKTS